MKPFTSDRREHQWAGEGSGPDVEALTRAVDASDRDHRDSRLGRVYHRGAASYREVRPTDSFHVVTAVSHPGHQPGHELDGSRVSVHVDRISPCRRRPDDAARLSPTGIFAHNLAGARDHRTRCLRRTGPDRRAGDAAVVVTVPLDQS